MVYQVFCFCETICPNTGKLSHSKIRYENTFFSINTPVTENLYYFIEGIYIYKILNFYCKQKKFFFSAWFSFFMDKRKIETTRAALPYLSI